MAPSTSGRLASPDELAVTKKEGRPPPPFEKVKKLFVRQMQGGPSIMHCKGIVYEITLDPSGAYVYATCAMAKKGDPPDHDASLTAKTGTLSPAMREKVEKAYRDLVVGLPAEGRTDGGTLSLELTRSDGVVERYVDANWGGKVPPPQAARGIRELAQALIVSATAEPAKP